MDEAVAQQIVQRNAAFYDQVAESFAATRENPWSGWSRCLESLAPADSAPWHLLDAACGNLRFEAFLGHAMPQARGVAVAADACPALLNATPDAPTGLRIEKRPVDLLNAEARATLEGPYGQVVCFGFFHHVPGAANREALLSWLVHQTAPQGSVALSFWRFLDDEKRARRLERLAAQAEAETGIALADEGDRWIPWKNEPGAWRFCHSFSPKEIDRLLASVATDASIVDRFDGSQPADRLNTYVVLERR